MSATATKLQRDMIEAMRGQLVLTLSVIRMAKTAIKNKEIEKRASLSEDEVQSILSTMVKQRKDSIQQFTNGNRSDLAAKEQAEILILEQYMPQEIGSDALRILVQSTVEEHLKESGVKATQKDMGAIIKKARLSLNTNGFRADGSVLSSLVKEALA